MLQRIRNRFTVFAIPSLIFGIGAQMFLAFAPSLVTKLQSQILTSVSIFLMVLAVGLFIYGVWKTPAQTKSELYKINPILRKMHKRLLKLVNKEKNKAIDWQLYIKTNNEINKSLFGVAPSKAKTVKGARTFVSKAESSVRKRVGGDVANFAEWIGKIQRANDVLDSRGFGLKKQRETDKKYLKLNNTLDGYRDLAPPQINDFVKDHIMFSKIGANVLLAKYRAQKLKTKIKGVDYGVVNIMPLQMEAGFGALETSVEEFMCQIRAAILECIQELEKGNENGKLKPTTK